MAIPGGEKDPLDKLSDRLYRPGETIRHRRGELKRAPQEMPRDWEEKPSSPFVSSDRTPFKNLFIGAIVFFVLSAGYAVFSFLGGGNIVSNERIELSILGPAFTEGGDPLSLEFHITNSNRETLEYADLIIEYPKGATLEGDRDAVRIRKFIGVISSGGSASERADVVLFGEEGSERLVKATLEYRVQGSNAIFVKEADYLVHIKSSPLSLSANSLNEVNSNQEFTLAIDVLGNSQKPVENVLLKVEYPAGFSFKEATPKPTYGENIWRLGDISSSAKRSIVIKGSIFGEDGEDRSFRIYAGEESENDVREIGIVYNSLLSEVAIRRPFLDAKLTLNGDSAPVVVSAAGASIRGEIEWTNNLPGRVLDAEIVARITGGALDETSVSVTGGFFNSNERTITWNKDNNSELSTLEGGESGQLIFNFKTKALFSGSRVLFKNPEINVEISVRGRRVLEAGVPEAVSGTEMKKIKIQSHAQLSARTLYYSGPIVNSGGLPPKVGRETTYTVSLNILNSSNDLSRAVVKTRLPSYVRFTGVVAPPDGSITYNSESREVVWSAGRVLAGVGIESPAKEASFQIAFIPSISQAGNAATLTGDITFEAEDDFTKTIISFLKNQLTTRLSGEQGLKTGDDIISE